MREQFMEMLKTAMKAGDKPRVSALRLITAALKDKEIEARGSGKTISNDDIVALLGKMVKSRQESLAIYEKAGREDLAGIERSEIAVIGEFLPKTLGEEDTAAAIKAAIAETGAASMKDMGKVVALLKQKHAGQIDFTRASGLVKAALTG